MSNHPLPDLIIYHKDCFDGVTAAWVVRKYVNSFTSVILPELVPVTYGDPAPQCADKHVVIVDFSYPRPILEDIARVAKSLIVLDHHKTAEEACKGFPHAVFDMNRSGAGLAWDWFFPGQPRPWLVNCIEDRDLWRFRIPETKYQMAYIATIPMNMTDWASLSLRSPDEVAWKGEPILRYIENYGAKAVEHSFLLEIGGFAFWTINISYQNCSDHLDQMLKIKKFDRAAYFFLRGDRKWQFGLHSRGDFDVSAIAKKYGGGGHKNISGFVLDQDQFEDLLHGRRRQLHPDGPFV